MNAVVFQTVADFCRTYRISRATAYRLAKRGDIPMVKIGAATRIPTAAAEQWAASITSEGVANDR